VVLRPGGGGGVWWQRRVGQEAEQQEGEVSMQKVGHPGMWWWGKGRGGRQSRDSPPLPQKRSMGGAVAGEPPCPGVMEARIHARASAQGSNGKCTASQPH